MYFTGDITRKFRPEQFISQVENKFKKLNFIKLYKTRE